MRIVTVNLPEVYLKAIEKLKKARVVPSRSEVIRQCLFLALPILLDQWGEMKCISKAKIKEISPGVIEINKRKYVLTPIIQELIIENRNDHRGHKKKPLGNSFHPDKNYTKKEELYIN